ncbi:MAG: cytochrome c oxidase subunit 3 [Dehalococcoidia bacterium]|nr:cytochrome c oxidase subunit 3 [Dehalococcoidia bacterium]MDW8120526.1 cytochrome c oxidase subunit 3 [Chloroflexota bacterium]
MQRAVSPAPHEAVHPPTNTGEDNRKVLMWLFLASDVLFFGSLIATFVAYVQRVPHTPLHEVFNIPLTSWSAFVLLMSSVTMALAVWASHAGKMRLMRIYLLATVLLGVHFLANQGFEFYHFVHDGFTPRVNPVGSAFFTLTGFHGAHVTVGVLWLLALFLASFRGGITQKNAIWVEVAGLYWHFVDVVWIVIFAVVYLIGAALY